MRAETREILQKINRAGSIQIPKAKGFYWGKWRIKDPGTVDENESPGNEWEVMHVVVNCIDEDDPEYLMVMVPGVAKWQSLENFVWGPEVPLPFPAERP